ncbi:hypothetical protein BDP81DRAFT_118821 [Colletotrichum phormii]|uniref:Uncharacterized protein n=1 Tax=Colletotrichum phormii TaxID=359342 RepID=A0AAI9ZFW5_9PEZI|nr:uncharacterized protein BDP81DRAFT_118821 [Colletotrichum phormii]KAK1623527.1 hypothetical protein BDP81DRAFT_118821 [Colletotrichum phormii]
MSLLPQSPERNPVPLSIYRQAVRIHRTDIKETDARGIGTQTCLDRNPEPGRGALVALLSCACKLAGGHTEVGTSQVHSHDATLHREPRALCYNWMPEIAYWAGEISLCRPLYGPLHIMIHHSSVVDSLTRRELAPGDPCAAAPSSRYEAALARLQPLHCSHSRMARTGQWHAHMAHGLR